MLTTESEIDPDQLADIEKFETMLARHLEGTIDEDAFRVFRLNNGIYGQRQGGHNQMVRVKLPYGALTRSIWLWPPWRCPYTPLLRRKTRKASSSRSPLR